MSTNSVTTAFTAIRGQRRREVKTMEVVWFVIVISLWAVFLGVVVFSQSSIHDMWRWFNDQSLVVQVPIGILFLP